MDKKSFKFYHRSKRMRLLAFILLLSTRLIAQDPYKNIYSQHAWQDRDKWQRPDDLISFLKLRPGAVVADVGCHEGYMTFKLAKKVGSAGKVFAVDVEESKLEKVRSLAEKNKITNVVTIKGDYDNPKLPAETLDGVIILDTYHEMEDHEKILAHLLLSLKRGGKIVICEPIADSRKKLTRSQQEDKHELAMSFALEDLQKAGFEIVTKIDPFADRKKEKGDTMWVIVAEKAK